MSEGQGGSRAGRFRYAHNANVSKANAAAISRLGSDFMAVRAARDRRLPAAGVGHRVPGFGRRERLALLQQLDGDVVGGAYERHVAVARWPQDGHAVLLQATAAGVDVVDLVGEVAEVAAHGVGFGI